MERYVTAFLNEFVAILSLSFYKKLHVVETFYYC